MSADPAAGVGLFAALAAGLVSFLSPCVLPLVPGYLAAVVGLSPAELEDAPARRVLAPSLLFIASFSTIFILLGLSASGLGHALSDHRRLLEKVAAVMIVAMGLLFVGSRYSMRLSREWRVEGLIRRAGSGGPLLAGAAFAIAWTPCVGPTLGAILSAAALSESAGHAAFLLAVYSAGLGIPFLASALAFARLSSATALVKRHYGALMVAGGLTLVAMGVLIWTGELFRLNIWAQHLLEGAGLDFFNEV
ncbi:MAG: cytochrome c biogenesis protein CcdA [Actinobacteria bacterium]|nr:cytochrome c biogenesis protein CcdA [Actinomycetota bacterium]